MRSSLWFPRLRHIRLIVGVSILLWSFVVATKQEHRRVLFPTDGWSKVDDGPDNYIARHECSFVHAGSKFFLFGGRENATLIDVYDLKTKLWNEEGVVRQPAPEEFNHFQATEYQGLIFIVGAFQTNNPRPEENAEKIAVYDPANNAWMDGPTVPVDRRRGGGGLALYNGVFYLVGGNTLGHLGGFVDYFDSWNPRTNAFVALHDAPRDRDHFHAVICAGYLYAAGGRLSGGEGGTFAPLIPEVDYYDFEEQWWFTLPESQNLPTPRAGTTTVCLEDRYVVVIGGEGNRQAWDTVEAFDTQTKQWQALDSLTTARHGTQAILAGESIYVAAGSPRQGGGRIHDMEVYGDDSATGEESTAGILVLEQVESNGIVVKHVSGNQGVYIEKVELTGDYSLGLYVDGKDAFPTLLCRSEVRLIPITCLSPPCLGGSVTITHSGGKTISKGLLPTDAAGGA
mmetsp:Transcript_9636/g.14160  ORF Transcript_9636/g.14160 Transcript_9636/m.14160 type:complete len:455 (-) Transcript_9636:58-1422(-)|eukprot:CAMPEP_0194038668 /NCGR_PEP_ID=MMETSP0009_2-20130614/10888_1 /TAXON_ID=210454 /ORGANISM="Grammatophora oceanica, Strain CCMP 410" /LENGTH=454 /DNA_ID=CAMNT_0038681251 /DNA_START=11 /DNA_END=1375 /DNA_ORIENTATION=+